MQVEIYANIFSPIEMVAWTPCKSDSTIYRKMTRSVSQQKKERNKNRLKVKLRSATAYVEKVKQIKNTKRFAKLVIG